MAGNRAQTGRRAQDDAGLGRSVAEDPAAAIERGIERLPLLPDPDLLPVTVTDEEVERVRASLGELPAALRKRLERPTVSRPTTPTCW